MAENTILDTIHDDDLQDEALDRMPGGNAVLTGSSYSVIERD